MGLNEQETQAGSSPRVRGKPTSPPGARNDPGLIPACAGKTRGRLGLRAAPPAHPRVCGENDGRVTQQVLEKGSSPRVRGKLHEDPRDPKGRGLIPACAGKT